MKLRTLLLAALVPLLAAGSARADAVDDYVRARLEAQHIPGATLVVVRNGKPENTRAYGQVDMERAVDTKPEHLFEIGSITKQFTATTAMMLVEAGKLGLEDAISKYLPDLPETWRPVTVRQLLTHTSGIPNMTEQKEFRWDRDYTRAELMAIVSDKPLDFPPGSQWKYNNTGYVLLGDVVAKASGKPFEEFLAERILKPLGMSDTRMADPHAVIPGRALGYLWLGGMHVNAPMLRGDVAAGAGGLLSTVADLAKWDAALYTDRLVKKSTLDQMWTPVRLSGGGTANYGFGWAIGERNGHRVVDHGGGTAGFSTLIRRYLDDKLTIILLTNRSGADTGSIVDGVAAIVEPALKVEAPKPGMDPDPAFTKRLEGIVENLVSDKPDLSPFTPEMAAALTPELLAQVRRDLGAFGSLKEMVFLSESDSPAGKTRRYRATYGTTPMIITATLNADGKMSGLWTQPE